MRAIDADALIDKTDDRYSLHEIGRRERDDIVDALEYAPTIHPDNGLQKLADEIASFKRCFKSENSDYLTGYLSALSVVEGMIADMREVTT